MPASTSSRHARTLSPPLSSTGYSFTPTIAQQRLNVVTRLAIEGKSKKGWDGAAIKMYLKISLPLENITPGATIALFPEENLKILDSQVHPLDNNSVPYNFSSTTCPLLHKAARALNLPARSSSSYVSESMSASFASSASIPPLEDKYTGHVLVSGYHVSYILPKEFPRRERDSHSKRGATIMHFMAAIDIWVPFLSKPPHAPFLLSIPLPRCLSNHIRLRIFPPGQTSTASSLASLSSADEDAGAWELASDPHVTRTTSARLSRSHSYTSFADDESSDASTSAGFAEGCDIKGTFQSAERIRVRWAAPMKAGQIPEASDGRRRVGIREVKSNLTCVVLGNSRAKGKEKGGVMMDLEYHATCKGVWFPGVATMLGMDVGLEAGDFDVSWAPGMEPKWTISGGPGFTGFAIGGPPQSVSRQSSAEAPSLYVLPSSPDARGAVVNGRPPSTRQNSTASTSTGTSASLLRAPLPNQNVADYSFESSPVSTPTGTVSSLASLAPLSSSPERRRRSRASSLNGRYNETDTDPEPEDIVRPPRVPITVHLNMNELLPPSKNELTFSISGTMLIKPRGPSPNLDSRRSSPSQSRASSLSDGESELEPIPVPRFRVFYTDKESTSSIVRNEAERTAVHVYSAMGSLREGKALKTALLKGNHVVCAADGARIVLRPLPISTSTVYRNRDASVDSEDTPLTHSRLANGDRSHISSSSRLKDTSMSMMSTARLVPRRDGPLMIPFVTATITPLPAASQNGYAVQLTLPAPSDADTEWLEFGLALPNTNTAPAAGKATPPGGAVVDNPPHVDIASASVEGVPVRFQTSAAAKPQANAGGLLTLPFEETSGKEWISWVSVHVGQYGGGKVEVIYLVKGKEEVVRDEKSKRRKGKQKAPDGLPLDILLPSFALPVGRLEVEVRVQAGYEVTSLRTNLLHQESTPHGQKLLRYSLEEYYYPRLSMRIIPVSSLHNVASPSRVSWGLAQLVGILIPVAIVVYLYRDIRLVNAELHQMRRSLDNFPLVEPDYPPPPPETVTVTTTVVPNGHRWWFTPGSSMSTDPTALFSPSNMEPPDPTNPTLPTLTPTTDAFTLTPARSHSSEPNALLAIHDLPFPWPLRFDLTQIHLPPFEIPESARASVDAMMNGLEVMWQIFRKVLHYPLDPP
ncbi:hypothetical protein B0H21DRAFT_407 [Amylocystis lapponica]|nr:hypothetical protein B0H21DRAFT_407 [Amylocystis lapponica]